VRVDGTPLVRPRPQTGLILQDYGLLPWNTVLDNVRLGLRIRRFYGPDGKHAPRRTDDSGTAAAPANRWLSAWG
jgi:ABC-type nitrate/sulfonate/bicarbonate transport system ATPase subunit